MKTIRPPKGFSLIELMVAMVAGLVVIGAIVVFTAATAQSSSANIRSTKVMQNLRSAMSLIEREIRRSGFDERALTFADACSDPTVAAKCPISNFNQLLVVNSSCIIVAYDNAANSSPGTLGAGEYHAFRLKPNTSPGIIQASLASATLPDCTTDTNWLDVSDPKVVDVTALTFAQSFTSGAQGGGCVQGTSGLWIIVQDVSISMSGRWVDPATHITTTRSLQESVRVKNDRVSRTQPSVCT